MGDEVSKMANENNSAGLNTIIRKFNQEFQKEMNTESLQNFFKKMQKTEGYVGSFNVSRRSMCEEYRQMVETFSPGDFTVTSKYFSDEDLCFVSAKPNPKK